MNLYINSKSKTQLEQLLKVMPQCILLSGPIGIGLNTIAHYYLKELPNIDVLQITPDEKNIISIDRMRILQQQVNKKTSKKLCIIIDDADRLTHQAQNSLLKMFEEPNKNIHFILLSHYPEQILPTVQSRAQKIDFLPISKQQASELLSQYKITNPSQIQQLLFLAQGLPAELTKLIESQDYFRHVSSHIKQAKVFLAANRYDKCVMVQSLSKDRTEAQQFISYCLRLMLFSYYHNPSIDVVKKVEKFLTIQSALKQNGNVKLNLLQAITI